MPGSKQAWPMVAGLLVAGNPGDRDRAAEQVRRALAEPGGGILHLGKHRARYAQQPDEVIVPGAGMDVEQQRARGVGGVGGVDSPAGEPPQQIAVDGAEQEFAALGALARARHVIEDPGDFGAGEIGIDDQTGLGRNHRLMALGLEFCADVGGAAVLPDDGAVHGLSGGAVPHHGGLALVGDADRGDIFRLEAGLLQRLTAHHHGRGPDVLRLVLDPAGGGEMLRKLLLRDGGDGDVAAKHHGARRCGALIDGQHERHERFP
ncbi:hypothetical protein ACVWZM_004981 [Bradyrhizobium sp. USDA 4501]